MGDNDDDDDTTCREKLNRGWVWLREHWRPASHEPVLFSGVGILMVGFATLIMLVSFFSLSDISPPFLLATAENFTAVCETPTKGELICNGTIESTRDPDVSNKSGVQVGKQRGQVFSIPGSVQWYYIVSPIVFTSVVAGSLFVTHRRWDDFLAQTLWNKGIATLSVFLFAAIILGGVSNLLVDGIGIEDRNLWVLNPLLLWVALGAQSLLIGVVIYLYAHPLVPKTVGFRLDAKNEYLSFQWRMVQVLVSTSLAAIVGITVPSAFNQGRFGFLGVFFLLGMFLTPLAAILLFYMWRIYRLEVPESVRG